MNESSAPPTTPAGPGARRTWKVGTLTYTVGGLTLLFVWLLWGDFAYFLKDRSVKPTLKLLFKTVAAPDLVVGTMMGFVPQILAVVLVPIVSYRSDRHRGPRGRRIPFLLWPTPFIVVAMLGLGFSLPLGRALHAALGSLGVSEQLATILVISACWMVFEIGSNICNAIFYALFNDVVPKELMGRFIALFRMVTFIDGIVFNYFILGHAEEHYREIFCGVGLFYGIFFTWMCLRVREGTYPPPPPEDPHAGPLAPMKAYLRDCFRQGYYVWYYVFVALVAMAMEPISLFGLFFSKALGLSMERYGEAAALQMAVSFGLAFPIGWLVDKFHPLRVVAVLLAVFAGLTLWVFFVVRTAEVYWWVVVFAGASAGAVVTASTALNPALLPKASFAQHYGAASMVRLFGLALTGPICGWFFDEFGHQYHYVYLAASVASFLALGVLVGLWVWIRRRSSLRDYVAP